MESILKDIFKVYVYTNNVLAGKSKEEQYTNLTEVLHCMTSARIRLKSDKCQFMLMQVHYLGHTVYSK